MKNKPDGLFFTQAICAENVTNSVYPTGKTAYADFSCGSSNVNVLGMEVVMNKVIRLKIGIEKWNIAAWLVMMACAVFLFSYTENEKRHLDALQKGIADSIIRFHVRANSDSDEDQELKLEVKEEVVAYMDKLLCDAGSKDEVKEILYANIENIENVAKGVIREKKKEYNVRVYFDNSYFPVKTYGDMTFPAGVYEAFRVDIGAAEGKNWWCVVYPKLCFVDVSYGVVPKESKDELEALLDEDEFSLICGGEEKTQPDGSSKESGTEYVYEFRILRFLNKFLK